MGLISKFVLKACETGLVPEKVIRFWCRRLYSRALKSASLGDIEARQAVFRQIIKDIKNKVSLNRDSEAKREGIEPNPDFFKLFLGERLNEGCGYFPTGAEDLNDAEETMLWMSSDRAKIRDGMDVLEIGCGWGAMTFWLAENYPNIRITSVVDSTKRLIILKKKIKELGLTNITFVSADFEELDYGQSFDRILCLERFDLIARTENWDSRISKMLKPEGKFFLQFPVHSSYSYYQDSVGLAEYPGRYILNPFLMPSAEMLMMFQKNLYIEDYWKISGEAYKLTAEKWLKKFYFNRIAIFSSLEKVYGKKMAWTWMQRWKMYFLALSEQFGFNRGQEWMVAQYLFSF
ncbi:MAG: class I SAM-dependent methyltransferase [Candidatus Riflebacteria bacterium]|nr:class I SAM-dependent methyltransferase [Candidatus Riflebacteria bacterium]